MHNFKLISILAVILFFSFGCKKPTISEETDYSVNENTLNNSNLGYETGNIKDYFYNLDEGIEARYLYYNSYITRGANSVSNASALNPLRDTLNFRTFPNYIVPIENDTINYLLGLTPSNLDSYSTLYPLDEKNTLNQDWCNNILVEAEGSCGDSIEVNFDYTILSIDPLLLKEDTIYSSSSYEDIISKKEATFEITWTNIDTLIWDSEKNRYDVKTADTQNMRDTLYHNEDFFDSLIFVGIIDVEQYPNLFSNDSLMLIDRTEWVRKDTIHKSLQKEFTLSTTFIYDHINVPEDSPMYRINGDCNQNLIWDDAEVLYDDGGDFCPDSLETGEGICYVDDEDGDGDPYDEDPCNCGNEVNAEWVVAKATSNVANCIEKGGYWLTYGTNECEYDPNGDNWRDCGSDELCSDDPGYLIADFGGTEGNGSWDIYEGWEKNGQWDYDDEFSLKIENFIDEGNGVPNEPAEYCLNITSDGCAGDSPFEDRNCNGKWDDVESGDVGNGIWDDAEAFIDSTGDGSWNSGEPLYSLSDRLETFVVDYTNPANPVPYTILDTNTVVTLFYGTISDSPDDSIHTKYNSFLQKKQITAEYSESFYNIYSKKTTYTNKVIDYPVPGIVDNYQIAKTKWFQDIYGTLYIEDNLNKPEYSAQYDNYGYDYHLFKIAENGDVIKLDHPAYFNYYGYYNTFHELELGSWRTEDLQEEIYIYTYNGLLRSGETYFTDTTIVTDVADYYVQNLYEVAYDTAVVVPFHPVTSKDYGPVGIKCIKCVEDPTACLNWLSDPDVEPYNLIIEEHCPPVDTTLKNTFKITKTKTITMIGSGVEFGLRNTLWLGSAGTDQPLGIVKDQLEIRWSEPYWQEYGSSWKVISRLELVSLQNTEPESSTLSRFFNPIKHISLYKLNNEEIFDHEPYILNSTYGIHNYKPPYEK